MSRIEWTQKTWNPIISGCSMVSKGCSNCYAMKMAYRLSTMEVTKDKYHGTTKRTEGGKITWTGKININLDDETLFAPIRRKQATTYFVNSMTDLFQEDVSFEVIDKIMAVIAITPQHTYQLLTKRAKRMSEYFSENRIHQVKEWIALFWHKGFREKGDIFNFTFPLKNLWLGVSVEDQKTANERIPFLLNTPARIRFVSAEPLLESVDFTKITLESAHEYAYIDALLGRFWAYNKSIGYADSAYEKIDWIIVGGESGHDARPIHPQWVRAIKNDCQKNNTAFFFKQWGKWLPIEPVEIALNYRKEEINEYFEKIGITSVSWIAQTLLADSPSFSYSKGIFEQDIHYAFISKGDPGRYLDGKVYEQYPRN